MSKVCPNCKREIDENLKFCPFCAAFAGDKNYQKKKSRIGVMIGGIAGAAVIGGAAVAVFAFDIFGIFENEPKVLYGSGEKLFNMSLSPAKSGDKWGYIGEDGKFKIEPQFDCAYQFDENVNGNAAVSNESGYGFINSKGEFTVEPHFRLASYYSDNGFSAVTDNDGYMLYVDGKGRTVYDEKHFTYAQPFESGAPYTYAYTVMTQDAKDDKGETVGDTTDEYYLLSADGKAVIGLPDRMGIDCVFGEYYVGFTKNVNEGSNDFTKRSYAVFSADGEQKSEWCDRIFVTDELVLMCRTDNETRIYRAAVYDRELNKLSDEYYCDRNPEFAESGLVLIKRDGERFRKVLVNKSGSKLDEVYTATDGTDIISAFDSSGIACVYEKGKYCGYTAGGKAFECDYAFTAFNSGLAPYYDNGKIGYINAGGEVVINAQYDAASEFYADGYAYVFANGEYGVIDTKGQAVAENLSFAPTKLVNSSVNHGWYTPKDFDGAEYYENAVNYGTFAVKTDSGNPDYFYKEYVNKLVYSANGAEVRESSELLRNYGEFEDGYAIVDKNGYYLVDSKVNVIPIPSDGTDKLYTAKYADEYFYGVVGSGSKDPLAMTDVNKNAITLSDYDGLYSGNDCLFLSNRNDENLYHNRYRVYSGSLYRPLTIETNNYLGLYDNTEHTAMLSCTYYGTVDMSNDIRRVIDSKTGECLLSYKQDSGVLEYMNEYFIRISRDGISDYIDVSGDSYLESGDSYLEKSDNEYYTVYGKKVGAFVYASACDDKLLAVTDDGKFRVYSRYGELLGEYGYACMNEKSQYIVVELDGKYVCLDRRMNDVFDSQYPFNPPVNGYAAYADIDSGKIGYLDMTGKVVIPAFTELAADFSTDGYARVAEYRTPDESEDAGLFTDEVLIDTSGETAYESQNTGVEAKGFGYDGGYFKTIYSFAGGYEYFINYFRQNREEQSAYSDNIMRYCRLKSDSGITDYAGNEPYQLIAMNKKANFFSGVKMMYDGTPVVLVYCSRTDNETVLSYYGLDGKEFEIKKHGDDSSEIGLNGYFYEAVSDGESKKQTLYIYDRDGNEVRSFTAPEYYVFVDMKVAGGYIFTFRYYYNYDKYKEPSENEPIIAEVYDADGKKLITCENAVTGYAAYSPGDNTIYIICVKDDGAYENRIYSAETGEFIRAEETVMFA